MGGDDLGGEDMRGAGAGGEGQGWGRGRSWSFKKVGLIKPKKNELIFLSIDLIYSAAF